MANQAHKVTRRGSKPKMTAPKLPEKWCKYSNVGRQVAGTRFVAFKTPLDEAYFHNSDLSLSEKLTMKRLVDEFDARRLNVGLVIDLTTSFKYYNPNGWQEFGIEYRKLKCDAHSLMEKRHDFQRIVDEYLEREPEKLIGVHCAHGLNRTGFLICSYMAERMGFAMNVAISEFEKARGHTIETSRGKLVELTNHLMTTSKNSISAAATTTNSGESHLTMCT